MKRSIANKTKKKIKRAILIAIAVLVALIVFFPIIWIIPAAFKGKSELFSVPNTFFPQNFTWQNFEKVFSADINGTTFLQSIFITLAVAVLSVIGSLFVNMLCAYALARIEFPFKKFLWPLLLFPMFIPGITIMLTSIRVVNMLNMVDTIFVLFVPGMANAYQIFFFRQFYLNIPRNIEEAAEIDGCSKIGIFFKIYVPLSVTPMVINGVGIFMGAWNSFIWPTLTVTENAGLTQIMQIIRMLNVSYAGDYGVVIAATLISLIVPMVLYAIFQKRIVEGIALTGTK